VDDSRTAWVGTVAKALGLRGEVVVRLATPGSDVLGGVERVVVESEVEERRILRTRAEHAGVALALEGIGDRTAAERLVGRRIGVDRAALPPAAPGEFYVADLVGLAVVLPDGRSIGRVARLESAGDRHWLEVEHAGGRSLVPFSEPLVRVEMQERRVVVDAPDGLFESEPD